MSSTVFLSRNKPQGADVIDICVKRKCTFIGYPAWRKDYSGLIDMIDLALDWDKITKEPWDEMCNKPAYRRQITTNWNLVHEIKPGCITLIPRPDRALVYAGRVKEFFFDSNPAWGLEYIELRREQGLSVENTISHLGDVAQGWRVDEWREVPFSSYPAWIRKSFFGRSTVARIHSVFEADPFQTLDELIDDPLQRIPERTGEISEIENRLISDIGPYEFEHLVVALLQLEQPGRVWRHIGGSGDGGVDGMGLNNDGESCALLQCKWNGGSPEVPEHWQKEYYFASLLKEPRSEKGPVHVWGRRKIAELVKKHAGRLPWALAMRVWI